MAISTSYFFRICTILKIPPSQNLKLYTNLVPDWYQSGTRLVPDWYQTGSRLVPVWYQIGTSLVPDWYKI